MEHEHQETNNELQKKFISVDGKEVISSGVQEQDGFKVGDKLERIPNRQGLVDAIVSKEKRVVGFDPNGYMIIQLDGNKVILTHTKIDILYRVIPE